MTTEIKCNGCGLEQHEARKMIALENKVYICDECINLCVEILHDGLDGDGIVTITIDERDRLQDAYHKYQSASIWIDSMSRSMKEAEKLIRPANCTHPDCGAFRDPLKNGGWSCRAQQCNTCAAEPNGDPR